MQSLNNNTLLLFPIYVIMMALLGLGLGMIISSFTTKYRDLTVLVGFAVSLLMYLSAVPYVSQGHRGPHPIYKVMLSFMYHLSKT